MPDLKHFIQRLAAGDRLSRKDAVAAFEIIMSGGATPAQTGAFLMALRLRGETVDEIWGAASVMRAKALSVKAPKGSVDTCGTGGDGANTLNISTAAAIVVAAAGVPVAKHGNKRVSSKSGSADVLEALGVNLDAPVALAEKCLGEVGIAFLMAPRHHSAMRHVAAARSELATRTIFNILGPLANPAGVRRQVVGVFAESWIKPMAQVLGKLGSTRAWVVHGADGLDELTTTGETHVAELKDGKVACFTLTPEDAGLPRATTRDLRGQSAAYNAKALQGLLDGAKGPYRDITLLNAAAMLVVAEKTKNLKAGVKLAARAIDSGKAAGTLLRWAEMSQSEPRTEPRTKPQTKPRTKPQTKDGA